MRRVLESCRNSTGAIGGGRKAWEIGGEDGLEGWRSRQGERSDGRVREGMGERS